MATKSESKVMYMFHY